MIIDIPRDVLHRFALRYHTEPDRRRCLPIEELYTEYLQEEFLDLKAIWVRHPDAGGVWKIDISDNDITEFKLRFT
jgi:hypothetical protein